LIGSQVVAGAWWLLMIWLMPFPVPLVGIVAVDDEVFTEIMSKLGSDGRRISEELGGE